MNLTYTLRSSTDVMKQSLHATASARPVINPSASSNEAPPGNVASLNNVIEALGHIKIDLERDQVGASGREAALREKEAALDEKLSELAKAQEKLSQDQEKLSDDRCKLSKEQLDFAMLCKKFNDEKEDREEKIKAEEERADRVVANAQAQYRELADIATMLCISVPTRPLDPRLTEKAEEALKWLEFFRAATDLDSPTTSASISESGPSRPVNSHHGVRTSRTATDSPNVTVNDDTSDMMNSTQQTSSIVAQAGPASPNHVNPGVSIQTTDSTYRDRMKNRKAAKGKGRESEDEN